MKIDSGAAQAAYAAYRNATGATQGAQGVSQQGQTVDNKKPVQRSDTASISAQGRVRAAALDAVNASPDVRPAMVAEARANTSVNDSTLATSLMRNLLA